MKDKRLPRLFILAGFLTAILLAYLLVLYDVQVNQHESYLSLSAHSIPREEIIEASRGIITDRKGRPLVSNSSVYNLVFDTSRLRQGEDQNEAILQLLELCQSEGRAWTDTLPISQTTPFAYTLEDYSDDQKLRFFDYLRTFDRSSAALSAYILDHPELAELPAEDEDGALTAEEEAALTSKQRAKRLLDYLPGSAVTASLLQGAGLSAESVLLMLRNELELSPSFSLTQTRQVLGIRYELALRRLTGYTDIVLTEDVDITFISLVSDGGYAGTKVVRSTTRQYETTWAAHILGTTGPLWKEDLENPLYKDYPMNATVGRSGAEAAFEKYLRGKNGRRVVSTNSDGKITGQYYSKEPEPGSTVELTIDLDFQQFVEETLAETVENMNAQDRRRGKDDWEERGAAAVVELVNSGELLALASYPTYDLSTYRQPQVWAELNANPATPMNNRATTGLYAPGSTLKPLTAVAALEEGLITTATRIRDTGHWSYPGDEGGVGFNCWHRAGHGYLNVSQAITNSCNYFFGEMGYQLGMDRLREYLTAFGLGSHTGIELGEYIGDLPENAVGEDQAPWAGFGQANQRYTPVQLANYIATLLSGGQHREAHLLKTVKSYDNSEILAVGSTDPVNQIPMKDSTLDAVTKGMHELTTKGALAPYFRSCVVSAGAKTGTAQLGSNITNNGVFVCFAPYEDPEIAISIVIEKGGSGAALASTAVKIINEYFTREQSAAAKISGENQLIP